MSSELHRKLSFEIDEWEFGKASFSFRAPDMFRFQKSGSVHGGILALVLDVAACFAVISAVGRDCFTVDLRCDFSAPAKGAQFTATGQLLTKVGRLAWADAAVRDATGEAVACGRGLFSWSREKQVKES